MAAPVNAAARDERPGILMVDDQEAKLASYEVILEPLGFPLIRATTTDEALAALLRADIAVMLLDVAMPDMDGFALAGLIRGHPRFKSTAIIFVSAIHLTPEDAMRGYGLGGVDYVGVPVIPDILRCKVKVFAELHARGRDLERLNAELEMRVAERTEDLEAAIARQTMLAREVDHRAKNTLAVVQSMMRLTRASSVAAYREALAGRIGALTRSQDILSVNSWQGAAIGDILRRELEPYLEAGDGRIEMEGESALLQPVAAQAVALAVHELATNAAKYGALSVAEGSLAIRVSRGEDGIELDWQEGGVPAVRAPSKNGFGSTLITASLAQLGGTAAFHWQPGGLHCRLALPFNEVDAEAVISGGPDAHGDGDGTVMVVESDPMLAKLIVAVLRDAGLQPRGPLTRADSAILLAKSGTMRFAIVDADIGSAAVEAIAHILRGRRVRWLLLDGAGAASPAREAMVLRKPFGRLQLLQMVSQLSVQPH